MATQNCRVCGLSYTSDDPEELPYGADGRTPSFNLCDCCGVEWGYQDTLPHATRRYRYEWLQRGAPWFDTKARPDAWRVEPQLEAVPDKYR